jgi:hypothetical protein
VTAHSPIFFPALDVDLEGMYIFSAEDDRQELKNSAKCKLRARKNKKKI